MLANYSTSRDKTSTEHVEDIGIAAIINFNAKNYIFLRYLVVWCGGVYGLAK